MYVLILERVVGGYRALGYHWSAIHVLGAVLQDAVPVYGGALSVVKLVVHVNQHSVALAHL